MIHVPHHVQTQSTECGLGSMGMILAHHGKHVTMADLRRVSGVSRDCVDAADLVRIARHYGLLPRVLKREPDALPALGFPLVIYTDFIHFTVVVDMTAEYVWLADPGLGRYRMPREEFDESYTGIALTFTKGPEFEPGGRHVPLTQRFWRQIAFHPALRTGAAVLAGAAALAVPGLAAIVLPTVGDTLPENALAPVLAGGVLLICLLSAGALAAAESGRHAYLSQRLPGLARHILAQSQDFFVYRVLPILTRRILGQEEIARTIAETLIPAAGAVVGLVGLLAGLWVLHPMTGVLMSVAVIAYLGLLAGLTCLGGRDGRARQDNSDLHWSKLTHLLENFESFKTGSGDSEFFNASMGLCAERLNVKQRSGLFAVLAEASADYLLWVLLVLGLFGIWQGIGAGALGPVQAVAILFLAAATQKPLRALATLHGKVEPLGLSLPPLDDLIDSAPDVAAGQADAPDPGGTDIPHLQAESVGFGFTPVKPALLTDVSLTIRRGEFIGITGPSGGGKSTLAGLLIGVHRAWQGRVLLNGTPLSALSEDHLAARIAWVNKHPYFFPGTLRQNVCLWRDDVDPAVFDAAIRDACLDDVVAAFPGGADMVLAPQALNLSGGQRQRLEIARALLRGPEILLLDEATDGLDHETEQRLFRNLAVRGITVIVVSHRASTLAACARVLRLEGGRVVTEAVGGEGAAPAKKAPALSPFLEQEQVMQDVPATPRDREALVRAFDLVALSMGLQADPVAAAIPPDAADHWPVGVLDALARRRGLWLRPVRFKVQEWWRRDHGPLIALLDTSRRPVAVLPDGRGGYVVHDPTDGRRRPLTPETARGIDPQAYALYPGFRDGPVGVWDFIRHDAARAVLDLCAVGLGSLGAALVPVGLAMAAYFLFTGVHPGNGPRALGLWFGGLGLLLFGIVTFESYRLPAYHRLIGRLEISLHAALYQHLTRFQPLAVQGRTPQHITRTLHGVPEILSLLRRGAARRLLGGLGGLAGIGVIAWFSPPLAGAAAIMLLAYCSVPAVLYRLREGGVDRWMKDRAEGREFLFDLIRSAARLKQCGQAGRALDAWQDKVSRDMEGAHRLRRSDAVAAVLAEGYFWAAALGFCVLAIGQTGGWETPETRASLGAILVGFVTALLAVRGAVEALCEIVGTIPLFKGLQMLAATPTDIARPEAARIDMDTPASLTLHDVGFRYAGSPTPALDGVLLEVRPGEIVVLTGPSGCGKTTLLRLILGFYPLAQGDILRDGRTADQIDISAWRKGVGTVTQDDQLDLAQSVRGHIGGGAAYSLGQIREAARLAQLEADIDAMPMGIQSIVDTERVSTGQKQRLLIARRLLRRPRLLILDEATNALPENMQADFLATLRGLGITCLIASHRPSVIAAADRVYRMDAGRVVWSGPPDAVDPPSPQPEKQSKGADIHGPA